MCYLGILWLVATKFMATFLWLVATKFVASKVLQFCGYLLFLRKMRTSNGKNWVLHGCSCVRDENGCRSFECWRATASPYL
jgi:hypothetical protein